MVHAQGWVYVVFRGDTLAGSVTIVWQDPLTWGERPEPAGYIHMLLVDRAFAGHRIGRRLLDWAERFILDSGRGLARLDCVRGNQALRRYYAAAGYELVGYRDFPTSTGHSRPPSTTSCYGGKRPRARRAIWRAQPGRHQSIGARVRS